jgi:choline dehydrogenase
MDSMIVVVRWRYGSPLKWLVSNPKATSYEKAWKQMYDTIIIGAGAAGATLAARLTEDPNHQVLLLEPGPDYPDFELLPDDLKNGVSGAVVAGGNPHNWDYRARGTDISEPVVVPRGRATGGSTATNAQIFLRGMPEDYDSWAESGLDEWSYQKLLSGFRRSENDLDFSGDFHGKGGPISCVRPAKADWLPAQTGFYEACRAMGYDDCPDHNLPDSTGVGPLSFNTINDVRISTSIGYLTDARHRLNLTIRAGAQVHRIIIEDGRAVGVLAESGGELFEVRAGEVILSAGAVVSPQLLMLSGIGPADHLTDHGLKVVADVPGVGQNLQDHPLIFLLWNTVPDYEFRLDKSRLQLSLRYTAADSPERNDMIVYMNAASSERVERGGDRNTPIGISMHLALNSADSRGEIRLNSTDITDQPTIDFNYMSAPRDLERMRDGLRRLAAIGERPEFQVNVTGRVNPTDEILEDDGALDEWIRTETTTGHHISCSNKMGVDSDPMAVVDQYGMVRGVDGLRVVDASIMPTCVRANINATVIAMAERMAELIVR